MITINTYSEFQDFVSAFAERHITLLVVVGKGGTAKSRTVKNTLGDRACYLEGSGTPIQIYVKAYQYRNRLIVLDDIDDMYSNPKGINLLKTLCQTDAVKTVSWLTSSPVLTKQDIPQEFQTTSKILILTNRWRSLNQHVQAIEDRAHLIRFDPSNEEIHKQTSIWFYNQEIYNFIGRHLDLIPDLSMRDYAKANELRNAGLDWKAYLIKRWIKDEFTTQVLLLLSDSSYKTEKERVAEFIERTGACRATYYNVKRRLREGNNKPLQRYKVVE